VVAGNPKKAAILNSRQGLRPIGSDQWIQNSLRAVKRAAASGYTLLTSVGMNSWEMVLFLASHCGAGREVLIPLPEGETPEQSKAFFGRQFRLDNSLTEWRMIKTGKHQDPDHSFQQERDRLIIQEADVIYPISIRKGGNLDRLIREARRSGMEVRDAFATEYSEHLHRCKIEIDRQKIDPEADRLLDEYVIHWTKAGNRAWPGETMYDYYRDIIGSASRYPRSGLDTLLRIFSEGRIRATAKHYREGVSAVAFSSLRPGEAIGLMKWRTRYREMSFEPYGVAIRKSYAETIGIRKVFYGNPDMYHYLEERDRPYFQSVGVKGYWVPEREYRHVGDVNLSLVPEENIVVIVWKKDEMAEVKRLFGGCVISLYA
jgi:hypothetical protein